MGTDVFFSDDSPDPRFAAVDRVGDVPLPVAIDEVRRAVQWKRELEALDRKLGTDKAEVDGEIRKRVVAMASEIHQALGGHLTESMGPYLSDVLGDAEHEALAQMSLDLLDRRRRLRAVLEAMRQAVREFLEACRTPVDLTVEPAKTANARPVVMGWLCSELAITPTALAVMLGCTPLSAERFIQGGPALRKPARLRLEGMARAVVEIRHAHSHRGMQMWFNRPRYSLDGKTPLEVMTDVSGVARVAMLAHQSRTGCAT